MAQGLYMFALGLGKKVLIADVFGNSANWAFANILQLDSTNALIGMLAYTVQIYFDFSGYCDMAIGIGKMMNIDLPLNFNSPYKAVTIADFWSRWHMTLTRFFTRYVYIPLGGSRKGNLRTYINTLAVFLISGIWHGANWTFILWGILHGVALVIYKAFRNSIDKMPRAVNWLVTFVFVNVTWVLFRADSVADAAEFLRRVFSFDFGPISTGIYAGFERIELAYVLAQMPFSYYTSSILLTGYFLVAMGLVLLSHNAYEKMCRFVPSFLKMAVASFIILWSVYSFSGVSTFLYFNF